LIMDYVRGESLSKLLRTARAQGVRVPPRIAASILCGFLHGLHAAHEAKSERGERIDLVHRDVSPQNVLVGADGIPRVLDFGIAKAAGRVQVTRDGQIKGKLAYMPPEQLSGRELSRTVDIYASAVVMWEMLTGERLFKGETEAETLSKILRDPVVPPSVVVPGLTTAFDAPLLKALSREAEKRHPTARELALELEKCVGLASASEVGDWVEGLVGPILSAREDQIAAIESSTAGLSPSGRPEPEPTNSDSDVFQIPAARNGTLAGVGAPSGTMVMAAPMTPRNAHASAAGGVGTEDATGSKVTGSRSTTTMALPVDKKLPLLASGFGLLVLIAIMAVVLLRRGPAETADADADAGAAPSGSASIAAATGAPSEPPAAPPPPAPETSESEPPTTTAIPSATASPSATATAHATTTTTTTTTSHAPAHASTGAAHATARPPTPTRPSTPTPKKNCDPPYTVDANGRKKYKLECM
jgi:eukaryotic-like serine/threonine-protein kinase